MDTLHYVARADDKTTEGDDMDESKLGVGTSAVPVIAPEDVEEVYGTANGDYITAHASGRSGHYRS